MKIRREGERIMELEQYKLIITSDERFKKAARFHLVDEDICDFYVGVSRDYMAKYDSVKNVIDVYGGSMGGNVQHTIIKDIILESSSINIKKFQEIQLELLEDGYKNYFNKSDADIANIRKCCREQSIYKGFIKDSSYRAFAVCPKCGNYEEF